MNGLHFKLVLYLLVWGIVLSTIQVTVYNNTKFNPINSHSPLIVFLHVQSLNVCVCRCYDTSYCITGTFYGVNQRCFLYEESLGEEELQVVTTDQFASTFTIPNRINSKYNFSQTSVSILSTDRLTTEISYLTTLTVTPAPSHIFWGFDFNYKDSYNVYNGVAINNATFIAPGYNGRGAALSIDASKSQYVLVPKYKNMTYTSFTWELWAYPTSLVNRDHLMIGMCQAASLDLCLYLMIRENATYFAFYNDDCWNSTAYVPINQWHHFAFVYDYSIRKQFVYFNGLLICTNASSGPFKATNGALIIGAINSSNPTPGYFWTGYLDQVSYISRAKTSDQVLSDATLVAYYSFDNGSFYDSGPNGINGTGMNVTTVHGRVNEGILFNGTGQYFEAIGFTLLGAIYRPYSIALWVYQSPPATGNGTILHLSSQSDGTGWCIPIIGLSASNKIIGQGWIPSSAVVVTGPFLSPGAWTHIVNSYSATNGIRLWINGTLVNSTGPFGYSSSNVSNSITLGNSLAGQGYCATGSVVKGQFYGMMDELRVYSRELNSSEVHALANP